MSLADLVSALVLPIIPCFLTVAYYDARVRREGFDLELAARGLDTAGDIDSAPDTDAAPGLDDFGDGDAEPPFIR